MLTHGSLFSGIGGFDLASEWMGWENVFHCEYDPFCQKVLKHHFPNSKLYKDVKKFDATNYLGRVDILTGGFPCQPFSAAGKRLGTEDERHLWPSMLRIIREVSPKYVVGENVRGLLNWSGGLVFEQVCADLEAEGYEVTPYILPACGKNYPHRRDRIWFIARKDAPDTMREGLWKRKGEKSTRAKGEPDGHLTEYGQDGDAPDTENIRSRECKQKPKKGKVAVKRSNVKYSDCTRREKQHLPKESAGKVKSCGRTDDNASNTNGGRQPGQGGAKGQINTTTKRNRKKYRAFNAREWPTQSPVCVRDDGFSNQLDGITISKWERESIKAAGNAIVPAVAFEIFKAIQKMEDLENQQEQV